MRHHRCLGRAFVVLALVSAVVSLGPHSAPRTAAQAGSTRPDLAAITVRPGDLDADGWVHVGAYVHSLADQARDHAAYLGRGTTAESVEEILAPTGWQRQYVSFLELPSQADPTQPQQRVRSYVTEYRTAEGAAAGFAYLEDEQAVVTARDIPLDGDFGEQSELTSERGTGSADGRLFRSLDLTFRIGNLVAGVTLTQYPTADRTDPDPARAQLLAEVMEARITAPEHGSALGRQVVRIEDDRYEVVTFDDAYYRLAGADVPLAGETDEAASLRIDTYADAEHVYQLWHGIDTAQPAGALYGVTLLQFPDAESARSWVTDLADILATNPFYGDIQREELAESPGDQALALSYAPGGGESHALLVAVRVGAAVARVHLVPQGKLTEVSMDAVMALASAQETCLQGNDCVGTMEVPDELAALLATTSSPQASPAASPKGTD